MDNYSNNKSGLGLRNEVRAAFAIIRGNLSETLRVSGENKATWIGLGFFFIPAFLNVFLGSLAFPSGFSAIFSRFLIWPIFIPVFALFGSVVAMYLIATRKYGVSNAFLTFLRPISYVGVIFAVSFLPFVLAALGVMDPFGLFNLITFATVITAFVVAYFVLTNCFRLFKDDANIVLIVGVVVYLLLFYFLGDFLIAGQFRFF